MEDISAKKETEIRELKKLARKTREVQIKSRYDVIRMHLQGWSKSEIAKILDTTFPRTFW